VERKNKCDTSNNRGNWNHLKIIQKIPEQHIGKARNEVTTENSHIGHCTHTSKSTDVKIQYSIFNNINSAICTMNSNYRIAATLYSLETWFVSGI
jgi:hypothetical protein